MGAKHVQRLGRARELPALKGYDTSATKLTCYGGAGFTDDIQTVATRDERTQLIDLERPYSRTG